MSKVKSGLISLLCGLAIYLSSQLWFANTSSRNFFYTFFTRAEHQESNNDKFFVQPYRLITNYGNNMFGIQYSGMGLNKLRESCDEAFAGMLKEGRHLEAKAINYAEVFGPPGYIYEYAFNMPSDVFALGYSKSSAPLNLEYINSIVFLPPDAKRHVTIIWLLDEVNMLMSGFSADNPLIPVSTDPGELYREIIYESSILSSYGLSDKNTFIAKQMSTGYKYLSVSITNPYAKNELLMGDIEKNVNVFFENPAAKLTYMGDKDIYTYVDANTVVKYYQNDILEYSNYRADSVSANLLGSFGIALNFIKSDELVVNEYYLAGFEEDGKEFSFYFDYVVNNFPMILPNEYKIGDKQSGSAAINHAIEVTVREGNVTNYKKIVYNFISDIMSKTAQLDFGQVLAEVKSGNENQGQISSVLLGYKLERTKKAYLYWIMRVGDRSLSKIG